MFDILIDIEILNLSKNIIHSSAAVFTVNTFQDLSRLHETVDNTERYIQRDIRVTYINTYGKV